MELTESEIKKKKKRIKDEENRLLALFDNLEDQSKKEIALELIKNAAYLAIESADLKQYNIEHGVKEQYKHGPNQYGWKESVESKTYAIYIKNYTSIIKQLNDLLPVNIKTAGDGFDNFGE